jgi:segregation and condensation protein B
MELKHILESILFSAQNPLSPKELRDVLAGAAENSEDAFIKGLKKTSFEAITAALEELAREHEQAARTYRLVCVAGSWQFVSQPEFAPWIKALVGHRSRPPRLSQPALETLSVIAYRQPCTRAEVEQVRGVAVDGVMQTLLERNLVEAVGRAEVIGRPVTYGTTRGFLEYFGIKSLDDLPAADELRRIVVQKPEALLTVDPGLATAPAEQLTMADAPPEGSITEPAPTASTEPAAETPAPVAATEAETEPKPRNRLKRRKGEPAPEPAAEGQPASSEATPENS